MKGRVALLATLGFTPKLVVAPLRDHPEVTDLHVFYGPASKREVQEALQEVRIMAQVFDVVVHEHDLPDAFDYVDALRALDDTWRSLPEGTEALVNGSGGPRPMTMAATIFGFTRDVPLLYYDEYHREGRAIPLRAYRELGSLGASQKRILQRLQQGEADMSTLATDLGLAPSTLSQHVKELEGTNAVRVVREGKRRVVSLEPDLVGLGA